ncbi:MAG: SEC-C metal-binding domain-containing protein [Bacteroidales bacterium]
MSNISFHAFTTKHNGKIREIITEIGISLPFIEDNIKTSDDRIFRTKALWDTGATHCVVTKQTAKTLNLKPISISKVSHANGISLANVYLINIYLPNNLVIPSVRVTECADNAGNFGVIIGMDVITMGDFSITNYDSKTTVSFRIPSIKTIDYVEEANKLKESNYNKIGRNDPCPCGSNKKYKYCHGKKQ